MDQRPKRLLMVEDNPAHAKLMRMQLQQAPCPVEIDWVQDGEQALDYLYHRAPFENKPLPDLILLDLNLPRINGHQVLHELKGDETLQAIPVVMITTSPTQADMQRAYEESVNAYLVKPTDFSELRRMLKHTASFWCGWNRTPVT